MFEKSSTELKHKQKLRKCQNSVQIVKFNVRTFNRIGQLPELTASAIDHTIDIVCFQEHGYYHSEKDMKYNDTGNGWMFVCHLHGKNINRRCRYGNEPRALKSLNSI